MQWRRRHDHQALSRIVGKKPVQQPLPFSSSRRMRERGKVVTQEVFIGHSGVGVQLIITFTLSKLNPYSITIICSNPIGTQFYAYLQLHSHTLGWDFGIMQRRCDQSRDINRTNRIIAIPLPTFPRTPSPSTDYPGLEVRVNGVGSILLVGLHALLARRYRRHHSAESLALRHPHPHSRLLPPHLRTSRATGETIKREGKVQHTTTYYSQRK